MKPTKFSHAFFSTPLFGVLLAFLGFVGTGWAAPQDDNKPEESWKVKASKMTTQQKLKNVGDIVTKARNIHNGLVEKLKSARSKKDLISLDCLGEKFSRAQALMFLMEKERSEYLKTVAEGKSDRADDHFVRLMQSFGGLQDIEVEAGQCGGKAGTYTGRTRVDFEVPPRLSTSDPTLPPWKEPIIYRPTNASNPY